MYMTIIFLCGMIGLIFSYSMLLKSRGSSSSKKGKISIAALISFILILVSWFGREYQIKKDEKYDPNKLQKYYQQFDQTGKLIGGTVYSQYPMSTPGLGWVL